MTRVFACSRVGIAAIIAPILFGACGSSLSNLYWYGGDVFGVTASDDGAPPPIDCRGTIEQRFTCFSKKLRQRFNSVSGAFAIAADGGALLDLSASEPGQSAPTSVDTLFRVASISKMFTAAAAVRLSQQGVLDLQRPISSYVSEIDADADLGKITVHQLLTHTAGVLDAPDEPLCVGDGELSDVVARAHIAAAPGAVYLYSNMGYGLVGVVIERVTGSKFEDVVSSLVLQPMGMTDATFDESALQVHGHAAGTVAPKRCRAMNPSGGLIASSRELLRWAQAMCDPDTHPFGRSFVDALTAAHVATGERPGETYGYGVVTTTHGGVRIHNHGGNLEDFSAYVAWVPERRFAAAAVSNVPGGVPLVAVLRGLSVFLDLPEDWRPVADGQPRPLTAYVGTYVDRRSSLGRVRVWLDGDQLAHAYLGRRPALLAPFFRFRFESGDERPKFVVTAVGVGERVVDP